MSDIYRVLLKSPQGQTEYGLEDSVARLGGGSGGGSGSASGTTQTTTSSQTYNISSGNSQTLPDTALAQNASATWDTAASGSSATTSSQTYDVTSGNSQTLPESALAQTATVTWTTESVSGTSTSNQQYNITGGNSQTLPDTAQEQTVAITWDAPVSSGGFVNLARDASNMPLSVGNGYTQVAAQCMADAIATAYNAGDLFLLFGFHVTVSGGATATVYKGRVIDSSGNSVTTISATGWYYGSTGALSAANGTSNKFTLQRSSADGSMSIDYLYCQAKTWLNTNYSSVTWGTTSANANVDGFRTTFPELQLVPGQDSGTQQNASASGSVTYGGTTTALTSSDSSMTVGPGAVIACTAGTLHTTVVLTTTTSTQQAAATVTYNGSTSSYTQSNSSMSVGPGAVIAVTKGTAHVTVTLTTATGGGTVTAAAGATVTYNGSTSSYTQSNSSIPVGPGAVVACTQGTLHLTVTLTTTTVVQTGGSGTGQSSGGSQTVVASAYPDWSSYKWAAVGDSLTDSTINATKKYHAIIAEKTGITVQMLGVGSTGYTAGAANGKAFIARCSQVELDTDIVTLFGSVNDWKNYENNTLCPVIGTASDTYDNTKTWQQNTFCANINNTFDTLFARVPTAKVVVFGAMPYHGVSASHFKDARDALIAVCAARHIPYIDMYDATGFYRIETSVDYAKAYTWEGESASWTSTSDYPSSFGHPSNKAHAEIIAPIFYETLKKYLPI